MTPTRARRAGLAIAGAVGFLSRLPAGRSEAAWEAFRRAPWTMPLVAYPLGALAALALLLPLPAPTAAFAFPAWLVALAGINHLDGVADCGDAAAAHGPPDRRREVMKDVAVGTGGAAAVALVVLGIALAGFSLSGAPTRIALGVVVAAEVGAKLGVAALACLGTPSHEGLGAAVIRPAGTAELAVGIALSVPAAALTVPSVAAAAALVSAVVPAAVLHRWARRILGGIGGDVLGAANELGRVAGLHAGVIAWTVL